MHEVEREETLSMVIEQAENLWHAAQLPLPLALHHEQLTRGLHEIAHTLKTLYIAQGGENYWNSSPCAHCRHPQS